MHFAPDTNKNSHLTEEMQMAAPRTEPPSGETSIIESMISFLNHHPHPFFNSVINIVW